MAKFKLTRIHSCDRCGATWDDKGLYGIKITILGIFNIQICELCIAEAKNIIKKRVEKEFEG
jgi:hypothetical protein